MSQHPEAFLKKARRVGKMLNALSAVSPALAGRVAFRIFCTPRRQSVRDKDRNFLAGSQQYTFYSGKIPIRGYTWPGDRADKEVLCLHGWESNSARWQKYIRALLSAGFTVHAFDAPASGNSGGQVLNALLYSRVLNDFVREKGVPYAMIGHSLGGAAAVLSTAILQTPRPSRMVLLGVFAESVRVIRDFGAVLGVNEAVLHGIHRVIEQRSGMPIEAYSVAKKAALLTDIEGFVLHDRDDEVAPVAEGRLIAGQWNARYLETEGLGHRMQDKTVVRAVVEFLQA